MSTTKYFSLLLFLPLLACPAPADDDDTVDDDDSVGDDDDSTPASLYETLGGEAGVYTVLDAFLGNVLADTRINWFFEHADAANLRLQLHDLVCSATGGDCVYTGASMVDAHADMAITDAQFDALIEDFAAALDGLGIPFGENDPIYPLVAALIGMRADIVTDAAGDTVYFNKLGGHAAVEAVIDGLLANVAADNRINGFFANTDLEALKWNLVDQVCEATGGYCQYTGRTMADAHAGLCITEADFGALVEDLLAALDTLNVPYTPGTFDGGVGADDLILALAGMQGDIVEVCEN